MIAKRLSLVLQQSGLSLYAFSQKIGIAKATLVSYRDGLTSPSLAFVERVCEEFGINPQWLLLGTGPMKAEQSLSNLGLGLGAIHAPGREASSSPNQDQAEVMLESPDLDFSPKPSIESRGFRISEMLAMTARVLESGTTYAVALAYNIQHFDRAITAESRIDKLQLSIQSQGQTISDQAGVIQRLEDECISVRKEVEELKSQLARLLATGGDDPGQKVA